MMKFYNQTSLACSKLITNAYSTSFSMGIKAFDSSLREPIYAIYGFVRYADEIVDTFHAYDKPTLITRFKADTFQAIEEGISLNPVLQSFQWVVNQYQIDRAFIMAFFDSMEMDLYKTKFTQEEYEAYIYGSAEVIGLMCLRVFCESTQQYESLVPAARRLGSAFQKINFLRDIASDFDDRGRVYFPGIVFEAFSDLEKQAIEQDIAQDFADGLEGIKDLPEVCKKGVYLAYVYYNQLFEKIKQTPASVLRSTRIRVSDSHKIWLMAQSLVKVKFNAL
ncbi:MAG: phytoene/squalene synthase family protein [Sphingobacteriaceae bacterium]